MKARRLWITAPYEVTVQSFELPDSPGPGQVLVEAERSLVSAGTELAIVMGTHISFTTGGTWPRYPMVLGYASVGRVLAIGPMVQGISPGDRVISNAPHASHALVEASQALSIPPGCSAETALLGYLAYIPLTGLRLAHPQMGEGVVVLGQGLIGAFAARLARLAGCRPVLGVDPIAERREIARRAGIVAVDPGESDPAEVHRELAEGRLPEIVVEATGSPATINEALRLAADLGRVLLLGSPRGRVEIDPYTDVHRKGISIVGAHARLAAPAASPFSPFTLERNKAYTIALAAEGAFSTEGLVSHHIQPEDARSTYRALAERARGYMGVILDWQAPTG
jgi:2-desacetyl-2-hydroxyethyl bacteriochlorophyllide A dehydrogenase